MNPELRRNLWLEFSLHRMIAAPVIIALIALLLAASERKDLLQDLAMASSVGYALLVLLWGTRLVGTSVSDEARDHTWDVQRMSSITPWRMTWGKLLGAPAYAWYGGLILLLIYVVTGSLLHLPVLRYAALMLCGAVLLHAMALNGSILAARKNMGRRGIGTLFVLILALLSLVSGLRAFEGADQSMAWWGLSFTQLDFALGSAAAFGAWALLGAYRSMCNELEIRTTPWALPAFIVFTAMYFAGFALRDMRNVSALQSLFGIAATGVVVAMVFSYGMLLAEKSGATEWQRLRARLRARQWHRAWQELPLWLVALATGFVMALTASIAGSTVQGAVLRDIGAAPIALILFAVRDAAIFQFFALARRPGRVVAATLFYLLLLYGVLPGLLSALGADIVAQFILPPLSKNAWFATIVIAVQAAIAVAFTYARWRKIHAPDTLAQTGNLPLEK